MKYKLSIILFVFIVQQFLGQDVQKKLTQFVNPFIGTDKEGHTFPGAMVPFGMIQLSPDTRIKTSLGSSGYHYSDSAILGFSHTHLSGTGEGSGGDFLFMPVTQSIRRNSFNKFPKCASSFSHSNEFSSPGYYKVLLTDNNVTVELTATKRVGCHKYTFPDSCSRNIILDLVHGINDKVDSLELQIVSSTKIQGFRSSIGGLRMYQKLYFVAEFSEPFIRSIIFDDNRIVKDKKYISGKKIKAYFNFPNRKKAIMVKVAISKVDINGAEKNLNEISGWNFDKVKQKANNSWNKVLSKIEVKSKTEKLKTLFYTSLYHTFIHPSLDMDIDGRYRSTNNQIYTAKGFDNYTNFSLWDTFRGLHPLHTIICENETKDFINTFIERYEHSGSLPMFEISGNEVPSMIGYHSLPVIADVYIKGIKGYNISKAIEGMKELANLPWEKRNLYKTFGFVPFNYVVQSVSRTLEYSYDDWCLAQVVKNYNNDEHEYFSKRGKFYKNLFSHDVNFMRPKDSRLNWLSPFNPQKYSKHYTQANAYQYTSFVPQDIQGLIAEMGGDIIFEKWLDDYFNNKQKGNKGFIGQYNHGNEPSHHTGYLYNYVGAAWKTQKIIRKILLTQYDNSPDGLPGNDDAGQISAWYVLSAIGFYSVTPGMDYYTIGTPLFDEVSINLENEKVFKIIAKNNSIENKYIQSAILNGKNYTKSFIRHIDIENGGNLIFEMGDRPNINWATKIEDRPYSINFNSVKMPNIKVLENPITPDGIITFQDSCTVVLLCDDDNANIFFTTDGVEPDTLSHLYKNKFQVNKTLQIKAKAFREGYKPSYTSSLEFRKLNLLPAMQNMTLSKGLRYEYREVWLCKKVDDIKRYPIIHEGIISKVTTNFELKISSKNGIIYSGYIKIPKDGNYTFYVDSDDGSTLSIDDVRIVNNDGSHRRRERFGKIVLAKGYHSFVVKHFQVGGKPKLSVMWKSSGFSKIEIPEEVFYH